MGWGFLRCTENHRSTVYVVTAEHADCTFTKAVVWNNAEEGAVDAKVGKG